MYCNKKTSHAVRTGSFAAFITFYREKDAMNAITNMNGKQIEIDGNRRILKATTGSTKYCSYFLRGSNCSNPQCLYLHDWANKEDVVTKEELNDFGPPTNHSNHSSSYHNGSSNGYSNGNSLRLDLDSRSDGYNLDNDEYDDDDEDYSYNQGPRNRANSDHYISSKAPTTNTTAIRITSKSTKATNSGISKFDYTRVVKQGLTNHNDNNHHRDNHHHHRDHHRNHLTINTNADNIDYPEFPPLGSKSKPITPNSHHTMSNGNSSHSNNSFKHLNKTPPVRPQKHRTKPPIISSHPSQHHGRSRRQQAQIQLIQQQQRQQSIPLQHNNHHQIPLNETESKSEKLTAISNPNINDQPPKISLDDTHSVDGSHRDNRTRNKPKQSMNVNDINTINMDQSQESDRYSTKSVNFDNYVDIVHGDDNVIKGDLNHGNKKKGKPRSKSSDANKRNKSNHSHSKSPKQSPKSPKSSSSQIDHQQMTHKSSSKVKDHHKVKQTQSVSSQSHSQSRSKPPSKVKSKSRSKSKTKSTVKSKSKSNSNSPKKQPQRQSHRAVAKLLLNELMKNKESPSSNTSSQHRVSSEYGEFKMSDLLKDGMLTSEELMMDQYNYYYFLQSDQLIFEQFHKQFHHHQTQKLQKSKA